MITLALLIHHGAFVAAAILAAVEAIALLFWIRHQKRKSQ
jgi:hypothetical protein